MDRRSLSSRAGRRGCRDLMGGAGRRRPRASAQARVQRRVRNVVLVPAPTPARGRVSSACGRRLLRRRLQNPLSSLTRRGGNRLILARHAEPTILVGRSYAGTASPRRAPILESAAARAGPGEDSMRRWPARPANAGLGSRTVRSDRMPSCTTSPTASNDAGRGRSTPSKGTSRPPCSLTGRRLLPGARSRPGTPSPNEIAPPHRSSSASSPSA